MAKYPLTIIFTVYNNFSEAETTIASLLAQSFHNAEIIISDDGSTNYDKALLEAAAARLRTHFPEVRININEKNMGTVAHVNKLYAMAQGEIIMGCSPGDRFHCEETVARIVSRMQKGGELLLTGRRLDVYPERAKARPAKICGWALRWFPRWFMNYMITKRSPISSCSTAYRKELFQKYGYQDEAYRLLDDIPYYVSLLQRGVRIGYTVEIFLDHSMGNGVSTGRVHPQIYEDIRCMRKNLLKDPVGLYKKTIRFLEQSIREEGS